MVNPLKRNLKERRADRTTFQPSEMALLSSLSAEHFYYFF